MKSELARQQRLDSSAGRKRKVEVIESYIG